VALHPGLEIRLGGRVFQDADPLQPQHQDAHGAVGHPEQALDERQRPDRIAVLGHRLLQLRPLAGHQPDQLLAQDGVIDQPDGAGLPDGQGDYRQGVDHHAPQGEDGELFRDLHRGLLPAPLGLRPHPHGWDLLSLIAQKIAFPLEPQRPRPHHRMHDLHPGG
jgi:hypothetical protein